MEHITIDRPVDAHFHARHPDDPRFALLRYAFMYFDAAVFMPNLGERPICTYEDIRWYRRAILQAAERLHVPYFRPLIAVKATHNTTPDMLAFALSAGMCGVKFYPVDAHGTGMTTNADGGVHNFFAPEIRDIFRYLSNAGIPALLHGEAADLSIPEAEREWAFRDTLTRIVDEFPNLRIVFEHISDRRMVELIASMPENVCATITTHHLVNVEADNANPHHKCLPTAKTAEDRSALIAAATSGDPKFFFGSDCAPHLKVAKMQPKPANGVFNSPAFPLVIEVFERAGALQRLNDFVSTRARAFYRLPPATRRDAYVKDSWFMEPEFTGVVPLCAGEEMHWHLK